MALTDEQRQALLILKVGGDVAGNLLAAAMPDLWEQYAAYAAVSANLRDLYVQRDLLDIKIGVVAGLVDFTDGDHSQKASQAATALLRMRERVEAQIEQATADAQGASGAAIGTLTTVTPETPPTAPLHRPYGPDSTDPQYQGSPYYPTRRRAW